MAQATSSASEELARLITEREAREARVDELEREARAASQALSEARNALVEGERRGEPTGRLEKAIVDGESAMQRWPLKIEGAQRGVRDAQQQVAIFVGANLPALLESREARGEAAAARLTAAAEEVIAAYTEREQIAQEIGSLLALTRRVEPQDVSASSGRALAAEASRLVEAGGEVPPRLDRDRVPLLRPDVERAVA